MFAAPRARDYAYFDRPFIAMAHRGGALLPVNRDRENSIHAFTTAVDLGFRYLETDVHATSDGVLVAFHDQRLDRVTGATGLIGDRPWREVSHARIGGQDPIPTLDEVLETFREQRINIDIKASAAIAPLVTAINRHRAHDRVCVGSFSESRIRAFRRAAGSRVATSVGRSGVVSTRFVPVLPRRVTSAGVVFQMPVDWAYRGRRVRLVTPQFLARAHAAGKLVHVWTIDDPQTMHELIDLGVDGLISDRIDVLKDVCVERNLWH